MACDQVVLASADMGYAAEMQLLAGRVQAEFARAAKRVGAIRQPVALSVIQDLLERDIIEVGPGLGNA